MNEQTEKKEEEEPVSETGWLWVLIQNPGKKEQIVGQYSQKDDVSFIPAFGEKEEARICQGKMALDEKTEYEIQAMHINDLKMQTAPNGFQICILNGAGEILRRIVP